MSAIPSKLVALLATILLTYCLAPVAVAGADHHLCQPVGEEGAMALPANLTTTDQAQGADTYTTPDVEPLSSVNIDALGLIKPGTLTVGTQPGGPPSSCLSGGRFSGFDSELLRAIATKLGLHIEFAGTEFSALLAQVAGRRFDVGSSSIIATEARRRTVEFTNGYDFGYLSLIVPAGSPIHGFNDLHAGQRVGAIQGTVEEAYVVNDLHMEPVKFPDFTTLYSNVKNRQLDAWVAPAMEARKVMRQGDSVSVVGYTFGPGDFIAYAVAKDNPLLTAALNAGLDAVIADGTWARLYTDWTPRPLPPGWKPGSKAAPMPHLPDFAAIAASQHRPIDQPAPPKSTLTQLRESFFDWQLYKEAIPAMLMTGLPNTLILTVSSMVIGLVVGMALAVAGVSQTRWLRWPARIYTDIFRGLPEVVIILLIGLGVGPLVSGITHNNCYPLGIAALGLTAAAYMGEIFRSGIQSVEKGQLDGARALGLGYNTSMRMVVIPQGVRRVLPSLVNQFIALLKGSALVYFLGLIAGQRELFQVGRDLNAQTGSLSPLVAAGLFYLLLTIPLTHLVNFIDDRLRHGRPMTESEDALALSTTQEMA
jgi:polar amino acid transport system substrate-binding protein